MIVFASFVPHSPLLIPEVGKDNLANLKETQQAYQELEQEIYSAKPEVVIIISPHGKLREQAFIINQQPQFNVSFKDFGDLVTKLEFDNEIGLGYQIKEAVETTLPVVLTAEPELDYGAGVPLYYLSQHLPDIKVIPIGYSDLDNQKHIEFGKHIKRIVHRSNKRVAVIASGDLSHKLHQDSPAGFSERGQEFDQTLIKLINENKIQEIIDLDKNLVKEAGECGFRSLLILLGIIQELNYQPEKLSYQAPFGIGYLVENFKLK